MFYRFKKCGLVGLLVLILFVGISGTANAIPLISLEIDKTLTSLEPDDIVFVDSLSDAQLYLIVFEHVTNESGIAWNDFHYTLGYGADDQFVQSEAGDGLGFVGLSGLLPFGFPVNEVPYSSVFTEYVMYEDTLDWWGGLVPDHGVVDFGIGILVNNIGVDSFTLREQPSPIPEPATMFLLGSGLVGLAGFRKRFGRK